MQQNHLLSIFFKVIQLATVGFVLFFAGSITALWPSLSSRLILIPIVLIFLLIALLSRSSKPIGEGFLKIWLTLIMSIMALWPTYMLLKFGSLPTIDARRIICMFSIVAMIYFMFSRKQVNYNLKQENSKQFKVLAILIIFTIIWRFVSSIFSQYTISSILIMIWEVIYYYSVFFVGALFFRDEKYQKLAYKTFMILAIVVSVYAIIEWVMQKNVLLQFAPLNEEFASFNRALSVSRIRDGMFRAQSTFEHPLLLAEFASMAACFGLSGMLWRKDGAGVNMVLISLVTFVLSIVAAILTGSRSALISLAAGVGVVFLLWLFSSKKSNKNNAAFGKIGFFASISFVLILAYPTMLLLAQGSSHVEEASTAARLQMLELGIPSIINHPIFGTGPGTGGLVAGIKTGSGVATLDNYYLGYAIESGLVGLFLLMSVFIYSLWCFISSVIEGEVNGIELKAALAGAITVTLVMHSIVWMTYNFSLIFLLIGVSSLSIRHSRKTIR